MTIHYQVGSESQGFVCFVLFLPTKLATKLLQNSVGLARWLGEGIAVFCCVLIQLT